MNITNLEMAQASIEVFGGLICFMLVVVLRLNRHHQKSMNMFMWMFMAAGIICFAESGAYIFRGNIDALSVFMTRICNFIVFLTNLILADLFVHYVYLLLKENGVVPKKWGKHVADSCLGIVVGILFVNIFTNWMYYFDEANYYHRNTMWYVYTALSIVCLIVGAAVCMMNRHAVGTLARISIIVYVLVPILMIVIQAFYYGISISTIGMAIGLLLMLVAYLVDWGETGYLDEEIGKRRQRAIQIVLLLVVMIISMSASIISCILSIQRISAENSVSDSHIIAHMVNDNIEKELLRPITVAETMTKDYPLIEYLKKSGEVSAESVEEEMSAYLDAMRKGFDYQMVFAASDKSRAYYTYNGICKYLDVEHDEHDIWYQDFLDSNSSYVLNVDTDEVNNWNLSVFVNAEVVDEKGDLLGVCGVGVEMVSLQKFLRRYEELYDIKIELVNKEGLVQVSSDGKRIEKVYLRNDYFDEVGEDDFYFERMENSYQLTKYMDGFDLYLVVTDNNPDKMNIKEITTPSIIIFLCGLLMMGITFCIITIREQKAVKELRLKKQDSITDEMTGLLNRRGFEIDIAVLNETKNLDDYAVIMMDLNGLKATNDELGHNAGDEMLIGAAKCMMRTLGKYGKVYRIGGDEFVALLQCTADELDDTLKIFDHSIDIWRGTYVKGLSISKGVALGNEHPDITMDEMRKLADERMYADKDAYYARTGKKRRKI